MLEHLRPPAAREEPADDCRQGDGLPETRGRDREGVAALDQGAHCAVNKLGLSGSQEHEFSPGKRNQPFLASTFPKDLPRLLALHLYGLDAGLSLRAIDIG